MPIFQLHKETVVEEAKKVLDEYGKNYVSKVSGEDTGKVCSKTCIKRSYLGQRKSGLIRQVMS